MALLRKTSKPEKLYLCVTGDVVSLAPSDSSPDGREMIPEGCSWSICSTGLRCSFSLRHSSSDRSFQIAPHTRSTKRLATRETRLAPLILSPRSQVSRYFILKFIGETSHLSSESGFCRRNLWGVLHSPASSVVSRCSLRHVLSMRRASAL